jgi:hypothetical protein
MKTQVNPFNKYKKEYWKKKTTKSRKGEILDTIEELTEMHRKAIVRKFKRLQFKDNSKKISRLGRPKIYDSYDDLALKKIWEVSGKVCGELLYPILSEYILQCKKYDKWKFSIEVERKLKMMSEATVKRKVLVFYKKDKSIFRKGVSTTKPSSIKSLIPIKSESWFSSKIGEGQLDTVVHCGDNLSGEMAYTLNFTDYKTYWIGLHAQMGKGQFVTVESLKYIKKYQLPFGMLSIHPDTGSEFINYHMKACCDELKIDMTRSRPGHCNDNMCVEERNGHVVRKKIGYIRIDCDESVIVLNKYYDKLYLLSNHFIAVRRTKEKVRIGSKYQRKFEIPRTPYQMVMVSNEISDIQKRNLKKIHESLNIFELQEDMKKLLLKIQRIQKEKRGKLF